MEKPKLNDPYKEEILDLKTKKDNTSCGSCLSSLVLIVGSLIALTYTKEVNDVGYIIIVGIILIVIAIFIYNNIRVKKINKSLNPLLKKQSKAKNKHEKKLKKYYQYEANEINTKWNNALQSLDDIKDNHLFNRPIKKTNNDQWNNVTIQMM